MQTLKLAILFSWLTVFSCAQRPKEEKAKLNWLTLEDVTAKLQKEKRPVLIDLYTDWCGWCKVMDKRTYNTQKVSDYITTKFYPVKIDAESKKTFTWKGKEYNFNASARAMILRSGLREDNYHILLLYSFLLMENHNPYPVS